MQDRDLAFQPADKFHVMFHHDHGTGLGGLFQQVGRMFPLGQGHAGGGLVDQQQARLEQVERPAEESDILKVSYTSQTSSDEEVPATAQNLVENSETWIRLTEPTDIPGLVPALTNKSGGDKTDVTVTFPDDFREEFLAAVRAEGVAMDAGFRGFVRRSERRCGRVGDLKHSRQAAGATVLLHHPVLLEPSEVMDRVAGAIRKVVSGLAVG